MLSRPSRASIFSNLCPRCSYGPLSQTSRPRAPVAITSILLRVRTLSSPRSNLLNTFSRGNKITASRGRESHARKTIRRDARGDHFFRARTETVAAERRTRRARRASIVLSAARRRRSISGATRAQTRTACAAFVEFTASSAALPSPRAGTCAFWRAGPRVIVRGSARPLVINGLDSN